MPSASTWVLFKVPSNCYYILVNMEKKILVNSIWEDILLIFALEWWISQIANFEDKCYEAVVLRVLRKLPLCLENRNGSVERFLILKACTDIYMSLIKPK